MGVAHDMQHRSSAHVALCRLEYLVGLSANAVTVITAPLRAKGAYPGHPLLTLLDSPLVHSKLLVGRALPRPPLGPLQ